MQDDVRDLAGPSFKGIARVAASDPDLWTQIFLDNRDNIALALETFDKRIMELTGMLKSSKREKIKKYFEDSAEYLTRL